MLGDALVEGADDFADGVQLVDELLEAGGHYLGDVLNISGGTLERVGAGEVVESSNG